MLRAARPALPGLALRLLQLRRRRAEPLAVDPLRERRGDEDAAVRAGDDADEEREGEVFDDARAVDEERRDREEHGAGRDDRSPERLAHAQVDDLVERLAAML